MGFNQLIMNMNCSGCEREDGWYPCPEYVFSSNSTLLTTSKYQQSVQCQRSMADHRNKIIDQYNIRINCAVRRLKCATAINS